MIYPEFLKQNDVIGITAPSNGRSEPLELIRLDNAVRQFSERGFRVRETAHARCSENGRSADAKTRAEELMQLFHDKDCAMILSVSGGDWLFEMLPYVDYTEIAKHPKWFEGMSDPTGLTYTITTMCDMATVYCANAGEFGMEHWDETLENNIRILSGCPELVQKSTDRYQSGWLQLTTGLEGYDKDSKTEWKVLSRGESNAQAGQAEAVCKPEKDTCEVQKSVCEVQKGICEMQALREDVLTAEGRLLGGCLDVLCCLAGTRFDHTKEFIEKYKKDGFLWYLEVFSMTPEQLAFNLWQLKEAGWFQYVKGILLGRPAMIHTEFSETTYEEAVMSVLGALGCPVIADMDFGHRPPHHTIVNGAIGRVSYKDGAGSLTLRFE